MRGVRRTPPCHEARGDVVAEPRDSYSTRRKIRDHRRGDQHPSWAEQSKRGLTINGALGLPQKNLLLLPERIVSTLQETGWTLRSRITWVKTHALFDRDDDRPRGIT